MRDGATRPSLFLPDRIEERVETDDEGIDMKIAGEVLSEGSRYYRVRTAQGAIVLIEKTAASTQHVTVVFTVEAESDEEAMQIVSDGLDSGVFDPDSSGREGVVDWTVSRQASKKTAAEETWQSQHPGECCSCHQQMGGASPLSPPICNDCHGTIWSDD